MRTYGRPLIGSLLALVLSCSVGCGGEDDPPVATDPIDQASPTLDALVVNDGDPFTLSKTVTIEVGARDNVAVTEIMLSEDPGFMGADWQTYGEELAFELSTGDGIKTVYGKVRDAAGNASSDSRADAIALAESSAVVFLRPVGESVLELSIANVSAMFSAQFELSFDPNLLEVMRVQTAGIDGHILESTGASLQCLAPRIDNTLGEVLVACGATGDFEGATGSGPFARITFATDDSISLPTPVAFTSSGANKITRYLGDDPPEPIAEVIFIDGEVVP